MLKKAALSLFGLAVMLVGLNPPQAHAGIDVSFGRYIRVVYVRPYPYVAPVPYVAYGPNPYAYGPVYVRPDYGYRRYYGRDYYWRGDRHDRRFEHREFEHRGWRR